MQIPLLTEDHGATEHGQPHSQLQTADPARWAVDPSWQGLKQAFFEGPEGLRLQARLENSLEEGGVIFPPEPLRALAVTPLGEVRVVILGQDPYHGRGQAEGLAFSAAPGMAAPPSLRNILKEWGREGGLVQQDFPMTRGSLLPWAQRGVLLLNTCLTVAEAQPSSHSGWGWEALTDAVIREVSDKRQRVVFMLWGQHAQSKQRLIDGTRHLVLCANHPSPLAALRQPTPFMGCGHFGIAAKWLHAGQEAL